MTSGNQYTKRTISYDETFQAMREVMAYIRAIHRIKYGWDNIVGRSRRYEITLIRHTLIFVVRNTVTDTSIVKIGNSIDRDHSTVLHALKRINNAKETQQPSWNFIKSVYDHFDIKGYQFRGMNESMESMEEFYSAKDFSSYEPIRYELKSAEAYQIPKIGDMVYIIEYGENSEAFIVENIKGSWATIRSTLTKISERRTLKSLKVIKNERI